MKYKLGELFELRMGKTPARNEASYWECDDNKWISISDLSQCGKYIYETREYLSNKAIEESGIKEIPENTVIMSFKLSIGKVAITSEKMYSNEAIMAFVDQGVKEIIPEYLYYLFLQKNWDEGTNNAVMGKTLNKAMLSNIEISLHEVEQQKEIVTCLDKISGIIDARKQQLMKLDEIIKSRFVEMFGDVRLNPHGYQRLKIGELIKSCEAGWSGNGTQRERKENEIAVLKVSAVTKGYFIPEECKVLEDQENIKKYISPEKGDLLFSRANTREMVGATAIILEDYPKLILPDKLWKIKFIDDVNVFYMKHILSSKCIREQFSAASTGTSGSMFNVSMEKFKNIEIPVAPLDLQNEFKKFIYEIDKLKLIINLQQKKERVFTCVRTSIF